MPEIKWPWTHRSSKIKNVIENELGRKTKAVLTVQQQGTRAKIILTGIKSRGILLLVVLAGLTLLFGKQ